MPPIVTAPATVLDPYAAINPVVSDADGAGQFERGLRSATLSGSTNDAATEYYRAKASGDVPGAQRAGLRMQRLLAEATPYQPRVQSVGDIHNAGDAGDYLAAQVGGAAPGLAMPIAGGLAGGVAGAAMATRFGLGLSAATRAAMSTAGALGAMYPDSRNAAAMQHYQGGDTQSAQDVLDQSGVQAVGELAPYALAPAVGLPGRLLAGKAIMPAAKSLGGAVAREVGMQGGMGAASTAVGQQFHDQWAPNRDRSNDNMELMDSAASNALLGAATAVPGHLAEGAHAAAGTGLDVGGQLAVTGGKAALAGGKDIVGRAGDAMSGAWADRPQSLSDAAQRAGTAAADLHTGAEDFATRVLNKDPDVDTLLRPQKGLDTNALMQDDVAKHEAAANFITKIQESGTEVPDFVKQAAQRYAEGERTQNSWLTSGLSGAVNDWKRTETVGQDLSAAFGKLVSKGSEAAGSAAGDVVNAAHDVRDAYAVAREGRQNAQTPEGKQWLDAQRDDFSTVLEDRLTPHLAGFATPEGAQHVAPSVAHAMRLWVSNGFKVGRDGSATVPDRLLSLFKDPAKAVTETVDLMHRQGLVSDKTKALGDAVVRQIRIKQEAQKGAADIVRSALTPTAELGVKTTELAGIATKLIEQMRTGKIDTEYVRSLFGDHKAKDTLDALRLKDEEAARQIREQGTAHEDDVRADAVENLGTNGDVNELGTDTAYHHYNEFTGEPYSVEGRIKNKNIDPETGEYMDTHTAHADGKAADLSAKNGSNVGREGYLDYLRAKYEGDGDALMKHWSEFAAKHEQELRGLTNDEINKRFFVLREDTTRGGEGTDVRGDSFKSVDPRSSSNVWAEHVAMDKAHNPVGGLASEGRIWLERADGTQFATSTNKIIKHINKGNRKEGATGGNSMLTGLAGQHDMLHQGLASLLTAKTADGSPALKGRVGIREVDGVPIKWLKPSDNLPDNLHMHSVDGATYAQARAEAGALRAEHSAKITERAENNGPKRTLKTDASAASTAKDVANTLPRLQKSVPALVAEARAGAPANRARLESALRAIVALPHDSAVWDKMFPRMVADEATPRTGAVKTSLRVAKTAEDAARSALKNAVNSKASTARIAELRSTLAKLTQDRDALRDHTEELMAERAARSKEINALQARASKVLVELGDAQHIGKGATPAGDSARRVATFVDGQGTHDYGIKNVSDMRRSKWGAQTEEAAGEISEMGRQSHIRSLHEDGSAVRTNEPHTGETVGEARHTPSDARKAARENAVAEQAAKKSKPVAKTEAPAPKNILEGAIKRNQDYLDNPPADYTTAGARERGAWAEKQLARVQAEYDKLKGGTDYDRQDQLSDYKSALKAIVAKSKELVAAGASTREESGPQGGERRHNAQPTVREIALQEQKDAGWDHDWPFVPADLGNRDFRELIRSDPSMSNAEKAQVMSAGHKLGVVSVAESRPSAQDPKTKAFGTEPKAASPEEQAKFFADISRRLGPDMKASLHEALFGKNYKGKDIPLSGDWVEGAVRASVYAQNLGQIGAHESMHEFFSRLTAGGKDSSRVADILLKAADSAPVLRQLERLLDGQTEALKQIHSGAAHAAEERLAYMFQFHQAGLLKLGPETQTTFQRISNFFRSVVGMLTNDQKADKLLRMFDQGKMQTADAAAHVLAHNVEYRENMIKGVNKALEPVLGKLSRVVNTAETNLERAGVKEYHDIRRLFKRSVGEAGAQGFLDAKDHKMKMWSNDLYSQFEGLEAKDLELAASYLHSGEKATDPAVKALVDKLKGRSYVDADGKTIEVPGLLQRFHDYLREADVRVWQPDASGDPKKGTWEPMGKVANYYPRVYDTAKIVSSPDRFVAALLQHNMKELQAAADGYNATAQAVAGKDFVPKTAADVAEGITNRLTNSFGEPTLNENNSAVGFSPFMQAINRRQLTWVHPEILKEFGEKDVAKTLTSYFAQGIKRAEYVRRFGNGGEKLQDMLAKAYEANVKRLTADGMDPKAAETKALKAAKGAATDVMAMEGTLGYNISPTLRRVNNSALVYENMRVLSTSLFSQFIDPMGMVVRGATMGDAWGAYKRGLREVVASIKGEHIKDLDSMIADQVGTTDAGSMLAAYGQLYSSQYMGSGFRKANDLLFKYNGMEGFNRGMQVSGTRAAINFIKRHVEQPNERSTAYLAELNLKAKDVKIDPKTKELDYTDPKIQDAIHQWVNGSVMRPNAAQRPAWGSDPHYMVFWHMKQFAYTFHDVIMKRAIHDAKVYGDMGPAGILAATYTPIMIAADAMKSVLLTGDEPTWMKAGLGAEIQHGAMRAGLMGKFQPAMDVMQPGRSVLGLGGPVVEQITQLFDQSPHDAVRNAMPGANLLNMMSGGPHIEVQGED